MISDKSKIMDSLIYDNMRKYQLRNIMIQKGFTKVSQYKTKMEMIQALELKDQETNANTRKLSPYARMTVEELKEQIDERNIDRPSRFKTKLSMILALEQDDKIGTPVNKVKLLVNKVLPPNTSV